MLGQDIDLFAKVQYDLPGEGQVAMHALHSGDNLTYVDVGDEQITSRYVADYLWVTLQQPLGAHWRSETVLSAGQLDWRRGGQSSRLVSPRAVVDDRRSLLSLEARQDWSLGIAERGVLSFGVDARHDGARYDYARRASRNVVSGTEVVAVPESLDARIDPRGTSIGAYMSHKQAFDPVTFEVGLRYDATAGVAERLVSPRVALAWEVARRTTLRGAWGHYAQAQPLFSLSVEDGERVLSPADQSEQAELGLEQGLPLGITSRVNVYRRLLRSERPRYVNAGSAISPFPEIAYDRVVIPPGRGRARGVELTVARDATSGSGIEWSTSYALADVTDQIDGRDVPRVTDQRHTARVDWSFHPESNRWRLAIAGIWHTGTPDTPDVVHIDTLVNTPTQLTLNADWRPGPLYSDRVPAYRRFDIRLTRYFLTSRGRISAFAELFNALDHDNVRGHYTNVSLNGRTVSLVQGTRSQLPRLPSAGFSWEF